MKPVIAMLMLLLAPSLAVARFEASVDATTISEADTVRLTLRTDGANLTSNPNLEPLTNEFDVLSNQRSAQIQSFNGSVDALTTWTLLLKPKHTGTLHVPAITLGGETTRPIEITVQDLDPQLKRAIAQTVFFETTYTPKSVYVQSQVVVTRKLFYVNGAQLYGDMPNVPEVPGAMVKLLGEPEHTIAVRDGRQYGTIEQRFAVFPERSGDLTIPAATVTGSVRLAESAIGRRIGVDVSSEPLKIPVLPIPPEYPHDAPWLPAADVEVLEDWPGEPEHGLAAGTPSQRTLIVRAEGNTSSAIPPLRVSLPDSLKAYPEPPKLRETQTGSGIVGTRTESTSLVATQPGDITVPETRVTWWDTAHQQVRTAALAARVIKITGTATAEPPATPSTQTQTERERAAPTQPSSDSAAMPEPAPAAPLLIDRWLAVAFAAALLGWVITRYRHTRGSSRANARKAEHDAYAALRRASDSRDPRRIRAELDRWLTARYALPVVDAARCFAADPMARDALNALNARLYQRDGVEAFDPLPLRRSVDAARRAARTPHSDELPSLYPSP